MAINRYNLVRAITEALKESDLNTYKELLALYYRLLEQEDINDVFLKEFTTYDEMSEEALKFLSVNIA